jgi:5-formyltetrahydrofolate cyclo-ligase
MDMTELDAAKKAARAAATARRQNQDPVTAGQVLTRHVLLDYPPPADHVVSGFWPLDQEIDIRPLLLALHERGNPVCLPVTPSRGEPLTFRRWRPGDVLVAERFGTMRPVGEETVPGTLLIPLLAFDASGRRLGYGGGFYDRTLAGLPHSFRLGCAFAVQQMDAVPVGPYDLTLDAVATERGILHFESRPLENE